MQTFQHYLDVFKKYAEFKGRANRPQFWYFVLFNTIISLILLILDGAAGTDILQSIYGLILLVPSLAVTARRLHDIGKSGWWILVWLLPLVGWVWLIILLATPSQSGSNQYGASAAK